MPLIQLNSIELNSRIMSKDTTPLSKDTTPLSQSCVVDLSVDLDAQKKECSLPGPSCLTVTNNIVTDFNFEGTEVRASDLFKVSSIVSFSMFSCERTSSLI